MSKRPDFLLNSRLIVKPIESVEEKIGKVVIPATANADLKEGTVILIDKEIEQYVSVGNVVTFAKGCGQGQLINGEPHLWLELREIWGGFNPVTNE